MALTILKPFKRCYFITLATILFAFAFVIITPTYSSASVKGLTLSPLRSEFEINPGTSLAGKLTVTNSTEGPMLVTLDAEEFNVINQQYDYAFTAESDVTKWVTFAQNEINLAAGETVDVSYLIGAPLSAEPGGRYISLFAGTKTNSSDSEINSIQRVASLLYITVDGGVTRSGKLVSLTSPWAIGGDSLWSATIQNSGTTHFHSRYNLAVKNLIGDEAVLKMTGDALILPGSIRLITNEIKAPKWPGLYRVFYNIGLGDTPAVSQTRYMLFMPTYAFFSLAALIGIIILLVYKNKKRKKIS